MGGADVPQPTVNVTVLPEIYPSGYVDWTGNYSKTIIMLTFNSKSHAFNYYRSGDYGESFTNLNSIFPAGAFVDSYDMAVDRKTVFFYDGATGNFYVSLDEGLSVTGMYPPTPFIDYGLSPNIASLLWGMNGEGKLYISNNRGSTWAGPVVDDVGTALIVAMDDPVYWAENMATPDTLLLQTTSGAVYAVSALGVVASGAPASNIAGNVPSPVQGSLFVSDEYMFVQSSGVGGVSLYVSYNVTAFTEAIFPGPPQQLGYFVVDTSEHMAMVAIKHASNLTNLYISGRRGVFFSLSLTNLNYYAGAPSMGIPQFADLAVLGGTEGIYIASALETIAGDEYIQTLISYDKGGSWMPIAAPASSGCQPPQCSLNLHLVYSTYARGIPALYDEASVPGLLLANGALGSTLSAAADVFVSRDAGFTWTQVLAGPAHFLMLDSGSIMVAVPSAFSAISTLSYSLDEGTTWQTLSLPSAIVVMQVYGEPGASSTALALFGTDATQAHRVIMHVDFTSLLPRVCGAADYAAWSPRDSNSLSPCVLGQDIVVYRRLPSSQCLNGYAYSPRIITSACPCASVDFECDVGFARDSLSSPCVLQNPTLGIDCTAPGQSVAVSRGYRLVADDLCVGGVSAFMQPMQFLCPTYTASTPTPTTAPAKSSSGHDSDPGLIAGFVVALIVVSAIGTFVVMYMHRRVKERGHGVGAVAYTAVVNNAADDDAQPLEAPTASRGPARYTHAGTTDDDDDEEKLVPY